MRPLITSLAVLALAGCATPAPDHPGRPAHPGDRGPPPGARPSVMLFISPMGEPFRAAPDQPYPVAAWFRRADANGDGAVDLAEFRIDALRFFATLDVDRDGVIDGFEVARYEREVAPEIVRHVMDLPGPGSGPGGGRGGPPGMGRPGKRGAGAAPRTGAALFGLLNDPQPVSNADRRLSQRIDRSDFEAAATDRYRRLKGEQTAGLRLESLPKRRFRRRSNGAIPADSGDAAAHGRLMSQGRKVSGRLSRLCDVGRTLQRHVRRTSASCRQGDLTCPFQE